MSHPENRKETLNMSRTTTLTYEDFKGLAAGQNLNDVTEAEYTEHYVNKAALSAGGAVRTIRHYRRTDSGPREEAVLIGWAAGSRQFTSKRTPLEESKSQLVTIVTPEGPRELIVRGNWNGQHGRKVEVEATRKEGSNFWGIKRTSVFDAKWNYHTHGWTPIEQLVGHQLAVNADGYNQYELVTIKGRLGTVFAEKNWDAQRDIEAGRTPGIPYDEDDEGRILWPLTGLGESPYPVCSAIIEGDGVTVSAHFGPTKQASPWVTLEDWRSDAGSARDLAAANEGMTVGIIGTITKADQDVKDGEDITRIHLQATAILALDESNVVEASPGVSAGPPAGHVNVPPAPAAAAPLIPSQPVVGSANLQARMESLYAKVRAGLEVQRQGATPASLVQANYLGEGEYDASLVQLALDQLRAQGVGAGVAIPAPQDAAPPPPADGFTEAHVKLVHNFVRSLDTGGGTSQTMIEEAAGEALNAAYIAGALKQLRDEGNIYSPFAGKWRAI
jgi:hypothetical protein